LKSTEKSSRAIMRLEKPQGTPRATVIVVPRERFSMTGACLGALFANTETPFKTIVVDGGSPRVVKVELQRLASAKGFCLIRAEHYLSPNDARNLALPHVDTEYVVFLDNDAIVTPGWLEALLGCADETGATAVAPLYCIGAPPVIHAAGNAMRVREEDDKQFFDEWHINPDTRSSDRGSIVRCRIDGAEFHCVLTRTMLFEEIGPLDPEILGTRDHWDFSLLVRKAGGTIYLEPAAIVTYRPPVRIVWSDVPYYLLRWSEEWNATSLRRFNQKWGFANDYALLNENWLTPHRRALLRRLRDTCVHIAGWRVGNYAFDWVENCIIARAQKRFRRTRLKIELEGQVEKPIGTDTRSPNPL
jgi:GT2 family glycosyltransferase